MPKGKKRKHAARSPSPKDKHKRHQKSLTLEDPEEMEVEYDDQAWLAEANNIVAELTWMNTLLERSIQVVEGSRAVVDWISSRLELFLQQQREFQVMLFGKPRKEVGMSLDLEEEDEVMEKASRSDAGRSGEADGSMEM